jgi:uncharacterized membrane protein
MADWVGRAVCANDPTHGLPGAATLLPLCARCAGMHLAVGAGWFAWRPTGAPATPRAALAPLLAAAALLAPMAIDVAGAGAGLWPGNGWVRSATGLLGGLGIALALRTADGLATSGSALRLPRVSLAGLAAGAAATAVALALAILGPSSVGAAITAGSAVASAALLLFVALRAVVGGDAPGRWPQRLLAHATAAATLALIGRAR